MQLILQNGYPYPLPRDFDAEAQGYDCRDYTVVIEGVRHFEWKYELTVEFKDYKAAKEHHETLDWPWYDKARCVLSAPFSADDGYEAPAIIAGDKAYCGFILVEEEA